MSLLKNAKRHTTIIEMKDGEKGYINEKSLAFSINKTTQEVIYVLFHFDKYSSTEHISDYSEIETFDIKITCSEKDGIKDFIVVNNAHHIDHLYLGNTDKNIYTILDCNKQKVNIFDAMQEGLELDELYDDFQNFIENLLEQDDDDSLDQQYFTAWSNFSDAIINLCNKDNRSEIETILSNIALIASNDINKKKILDYFSDPQKCIDYLISLSKEEIKGHIEADILEDISSIGGVFYEIFMKGGDDSMGKTNLKEENFHKTGDDKQKQIKDLKSALKVAKENENYEEASRIRDELITLGVNNIEL